MRNNLIKVNIDKETLITIGSAFLMVTLSFIMNLFQKNEFVTIILRNILMIFLLGFCFPLYYILIRKRKNLSELGFTRKKLGISLIINVVLAVLLFMIFSHKQHSAISVNLNSFYAITYIIVAGIFEMIFIYGFLRYEFERSFGTIPAIILTAIFYSLHHAGFQPEFKKLFFVGIMYVSVFYITKNIFAIFPFFWGVGAIWDVLVNSAAGNRITNTISFVIAIMLIVAMIIAFILLYRKKQIAQCYPTCR